jgi:UDP-N-acetylmuramoyl-tripeptide--D-alanyl-D-alanine ligase
MIPLTAEEAGAALGVAGFDRPVKAVSTDSRSVAPGDLFVALRGERFDGHDYVGAVLAAGASGAVVDEAWWREGRNPAAGAMSAQARSGVVPVADTLAALGALARAVRRKSPACVIAVTGSIGKTGTKDLLGRMASRVGPTIVTAANQNNEIGVPLTLLGIQPDTAVVVVEMGMRGLGQIAALTEIVEPDVGVVTNIHPVHLELLGTLEHVAQAKAEILAGLRPDGVGVVPGDCEILDPLVAAHGRRVVRFGLEGESECADVWCRSERIGVAGGATLTIHWPGGEAVVRTPFGARAKVENAMAATAACYAARLPVEECVKGLEEAAFTPSRGDLEAVGGWLIINDTYNASPAAVKASVDELVHIAEHEGRRAVAVLGDMLELGPEGDRFHREIGAYAAEKGVRVLWGVGPLAQATAAGFRAASGAKCVAGHVPSSVDFQPVCASLRPDDVILFKASRSLRLEMMVDLLRQVATELSSSEGSGRA